MLSARESHKFWEPTPETAPLVGGAPDAVRVYPLQQLVWTSGRVDLMLAMRALNYAEEVSEKSEEITEAALLAYLETHGR